MRCKIDVFFVVVAFNSTENQTKRTSNRLYRCVWQYLIVVVVIAAARLQQLSEENGRSSLKFRHTRMTLRCDMVIYVIFCIYLFICVWMDFCWCRILICARWKWRRRRRRWWRWGIKKTATKLFINV